MERCRTNTFYFNDMLILYILYLQQPRQKQAVLRCATSHHPFGDPFVCDLMGQPIILCEQHRSLSIAGYFMRSDCIPNMAPLHVMAFLNAC